MIKILLERKVEKKKLDALVAKLNDLRALALRQPGYIAGETFFKEEDPVDVLVISTWLSEDYWEAWTNSEKAIEINDSINSLIIGEAEINTYYTAQGVGITYE